MSAKLDIEANAGGAVKALNELNKALDATAKGAEGAIAPSKALQAAAMRIKEAVEPQERFNRKLQETKAALDAGLISQQQYEKQVKRLEEQLERAGKASGKTFSMDSIAAVGKMGLEVMGISNALSLAVQGMKEFDAERRKAADDAVRARSGIGQLSQLAASDKDPKAAFKALVAEADSYLAMGAAGDRGEAATLTFDLAAAGLEKEDRAFAAKMRATGTLQNVGGLGAAYDAMRTALGAGEVGTFEEFAGKALAAGAAAPGTVEQLPVALARAGSSAKALGLNDESLLAAGAILAKEAGSPAEGGTKLAALLSGIQRAGVDVKGMNFAQMIERFASENTGFGGVFKDNDQAIGAFRTIAANITPVKDLERDIFAAQSQGLAMQAVGLPNLDDSQRAANMRFQHEGDLALVNDRLLSRGENLRQAAMADWSANLRRTSPGLGTEIDIFAERVGANIPIFGDPNRALLHTQNGNMPLSDPKLAEEIRDHLKAISANTNAMKTNQRSRITTKQE